jgi:hypothetical protein
MPATIFKLLDKTARKTERTNTQNATFSSRPFSAGKTRLAVPSLMAGKLPRLTRISARGLLTVARFTLARCFTSFRGTRVSFDTTATLRRTDAGCHAVNGLRRCTRDSRFADAVKVFYGLLKTFY